MSGIYTDADARRLGLVDPTSTPSQSPDVKTVPMLDTLAGKCIGLLDNCKTNSAALLGRIGEKLMRDHGAAKVVARSKQIYSRIAPTELIDELAANCDAVVTAIGD